MNNIDPTIGPRQILACPEPAGAIEPVCTQALCIQPMRTRPQRIRRVQALAAAALTAALSFSAGAGAADAGDRRHGRDRYLDYGRVIDVRPVYREIAIREPRRECVTERPGRDFHPRPGQHDRYDRNDRYNRHDRFDRGHDRAYRRDYTGNVQGNTVIAGVIGGVLGNQLGRNAGDGGRVAATVAGAVIGSAIGRDVSSGHRPRHTPDRYRHGPVERCRQVVDTRYETRLDYYDVTYVFRGRTFHTRRDHAPGKRIRIDISVPPSRR